jgi:hypothetical protein
VSRQFKRAAQRRAGWLCWPEMAVNAGGSTPAAPPTNSNPPVVMSLDNRKREHPMIRCPSLLPSPNNAAIKD